MADFPNRSVNFVDPTISNSLHAGVSPADLGVMERHPVETIQKNALLKAEETEFARLKLIHGTHAPLRMKMERLHLAQIPGHRGLNTFGLETAMGRNLRFDFEDYLGTVQEEPDRLSFHQKMEAALKM